MKYCKVVLLLVAQNSLCAGQSGEFTLIYFGETSRSNEAIAYHKSVHGTFSMDDEMKEFFVSVNGVESYGNPEADTYLLPEVAGEFQAARSGKKYETSSKVLDSRELEVAAGYFEMLINGLAATTENKSIEHKTFPIWDRKGTHVESKESPHFSYYGRFSAETWILKKANVAYYIKVDSDLKLKQFAKLIDFIRSESADDYDRFLQSFGRHFSLLLNEDGRLPSCSVIAIKFDD